MANSLMTMQRKKRTDLVAKIDAEVLKMAKYIATYKGITIAELISETLRPIFAKQIHEVGQELLKRPKPDKRDK